MPSPQQIRWAKFRTTAVTVVALIIMGVLLFLLTGGSLFQERVTLYLHIGDATGLTSDSPVRVNGIDVGKVESVFLTGSNEPNRIIRVSLTIQREHLRDIPVDSYAELSADTVVGDKFVDITRGRSNMPLAPGGEIVYKPQPDLIKTLDLEQFAASLRGMESLLDDIEQGRNGMSDLLIKDDLYNQLRAQIDNFARQAKSAEDRATRIGSLLYSDDLHRQFIDRIVAIDNRLAAIQSGQDPLSRYLRSDADYNTLRRQIDDLRKSVTSIQSQPFIRSDEQYASWNRTLASLIRSVDAVNANPLVSSPQLYESLNGFLQETRNTVADFRKDPKKYLRLKVF